MKIALCGRFNTEKKHQGGSAEVFLTLAKGLSKGNEVTIFGRGEPNEEIKRMCQENKISYHYIPSDSLFNILLGPLRALRLLKKNFNDFDVIHTHTGSFAFASVFFKKKSKIITHVHESLILKDNPLIIRGYLTLENFLLRFAAKNSALVVTVGEYMKNLVVDKWRITNVVSIPNGADLSLFRFKKSKKVERLFKENNFRLLFVGRITKRKGIIELVKSFDYLKGEKITLMIVGDGELHDDIKKNLPKECRMIKFVDNSDLPYYYSSADLVIVPSHYEPGSLVPRESLACGTPVLAASNTGLAEIKIAKFFERVEPKLIADSIKKSMSTKLPSQKKCRDYALKNYDLEKIFRKYEDNYKRLLFKK